MQRFVAHKTNKRPPTRTHLFNQYQQQPKPTQKNAKSIRRTQTALAVVNPRDAGQFSLATLSLGAWSETSADLTVGVWFRFTDVGQLSYDARIVRYIYQFVDLILLFLFLFLFLFFVFCFVLFFTFLLYFLKFRFVWYNFINRI